MHYGLYLYTAVKPVMCCFVVQVLCDIRKRNLKTNDERRDKEITIRKQGYEQLFDEPLTR